MLDRTIDDWSIGFAVAIGLTFVLDLGLTLVGARASEAVANRWTIEGSYELNPRWQDQIDRRRLVSLRFVLVALAIPALLVALREVIVVAEVDRALFAAAVGAFLLLQAPTIMTHAGNLTTFRALADPTAAEGRIRMSRWFVYDQSAWAYARFAALWLLLWLVSQQAFFLGGVVGCGLIAMQFRRLGRLARPLSATVSPPGRPPNPVRPFGPVSPSAAESTPPRGSGSGSLP